MTDKQIIIDGIDVRDCCEWYSLPDGKLYCRINNKGKFTCKSNPDCQFKQFARAKEENKKLKSQITSQDCEIYDLKSELQAKEQECEALQMSENEDGEMIAELKAYKDINEDFKTAWEELKAENEELIRRITKIFACLIKANRTNKIVDTLWVDNITTLWDYIAQTLGIEGDQVQVEEQILQKISESEANQ